MKLFARIATLLLVLSMLVTAFTACDKKEDDKKPAETQPESQELVDLAGTMKFDPNSGRAHVEAKVRLFIDGDTTHFDLSSPVIGSSILKARYLGINTPESTGQIEPWGKKASNYTKEALSNATSIMLESNDDKWNADSTGDRYLVWVWYKTAENPEYRCLNFEILQNGLAVASKLSDTVYYDICTQMIDQAVRHKLHVHSKEKDPEFYYGDAMPITLKELKTNIGAYTGKSVSFEGVVARKSGNTAYIEEYDEESGLSFGMQVYYGYNLSFDGQEILSVGNRVLVVGSVQYYEAGGTYQISDIQYNVMRPDDAENIQLVSEGHAAAYQVFDAKALLNDKIELQITVVDQDGEETLENKSFDIGFLSMHSTASLKGLTILEVYTTKNEDSSNFGALSLTCRAEDGTTIVVRTAVLRDSEGQMVTAEAFPVGSKIDARGIVDVYEGKYQLKVFSPGDITFVAE